MGGTSEATDYLRAMWTQFVVVDAAVVVFVVFQLCTCMDLPIVLVSLIERPPVLSVSCHG